MMDSRVKLRDHNIIGSGNSFHFQNSNPEKAKAFQGKESSLEPALKTEIFDPIASRQKPNQKQIVTKITV